AAPSAPSGGSYLSSTTTSVPRPPGAVLKQTLPRFATLAPSTELQASCSLGLSSVISASHSTLVPAGAVARQRENWPSSLTDTRCAMNLGKFSSLRQNAYTSGGERLMVMLRTT